MKMLVFVPMTGTGDRYIRAGYVKPKPLIDVDGKPMIERVLETFPKDIDYLFAVNRLHAETTDVLAVLSRIRPNARTIVIDPHKDGPVQTVLACREAIPADVPVCLNYCDFGVDWSFAKFSEWLERGGWDGAMTAYRGFHPHSLGPTLYAYMRNEGDRVLEIREKHHFTANKFDEYASSGLYWFRSGAKLLEACEALVKRGERVQNEFYVSSAMQMLIDGGGKVGVYPLDHFYQWGTPDDLRDYEGWARAMRHAEDHLERLKKARSRSTQLLPMAGRGQRFADRGYADPKPLIDVLGAPMIARALDHLFRPTARTLVALSDHAQDARFRAAAKTLAPPANVVELDEVTEGQACTAEIGARTLPANDPVLIAPCDTGYVYDIDRWLDLERSDADLVVWTAKNHLPAIWRPQMYGWVHAPNGMARSVSVKTAVPDVPLADQEAVTGTFWFSSAASFTAEVKAMVAANDRIKNEFYIDTIAKRMTEAGKKVRTFCVDKWMPWGTPEELDTFLYWNQVFRSGRTL